MNVLEVAGISGGGIGRHLCGLSAGLAENGHRVTMVYAPHDIDPALQEFVRKWKDEIRFSPLDIRREISPTSDLRALVELRRIIKREGPFDVIHGHSAKGGALARAAGRLSGIPAFYTPNSLISSSPETSRSSAVFYNWIERVLGWTATAKIIAVSEGERDLIRAAKLAPKSRIVLIHNGIEDGEFEEPSPSGPLPSLEEKPLTFGATIRFAKQKDPANLLEAFARLLKLVPDLPMKLVVAGDGELLPEASRLVEERGMEKQVSLLGWRPDVQSLLREFDVFVLPSLYEGFSYSLIEAMAAGLPIVSTEVFGTRETVARLPGNVVVPVGDFAALAEGMKRVSDVADREGLRSKLRKVGLVNHEYARENFRQSYITRRTIELYQEVLRGG